MKFIVPLPPTLNATYKTGQGRFYKAKVAKDWEEEAGYLILSKMVKLREKRITEPCSVELDMYINRDRDIDSSIKIVLDLLQSSRILENDRLVHDLHVNKFINKQDPHLEVNITVYD